MNTCTQKLGPMGIYKKTAAQQGRLYKWMELESATDFQCLTILCLFCFSAKSYVGREWTYVLHNDKPEL